MIVQLGGGLDLVTAKTHAAPGTLQDCLNFEVAFMQGYRRIDGFLRYDGRPVPGSVTLYTLRAEYASDEDSSGSLGFIPLYEEPTYTWPPEDFGLLNAGQEVYFQRAEAVGVVPFGAFTVNWSKGTRGLIVQPPQFIEVTGPVDLSNRTGLIFSEKLISEPKGEIAPNTPSVFYGREAISDSDHRRETVFPTGVGLPALSSLPGYNFGIFNNQPRSNLVDLLNEDNGLSWESYNQTWKLNLDAYRQTVTEFPGGTALGMTYYRDHLYAVAETLSWNYTLEDEGLRDASIPGQWAYFQRDHVIENDGPLGPKNPRSVLEGALQSVRVMQFKDGQIELLTPELDPANPNEPQDPSGKELFLMTELVFWKDEVFPQVGDIITDGTRTAEVMFVERDIDDPAVPTEWRDFENNGIMLVRGDTSVWGKGALLEVQGKSGDLVVWRAMGASSDSPVATIGEKEDTDRAVVVRDTVHSGFHPIDMGYEIQFFNGEEQIRDVFTQAGFGEEPEEATFETDPTYAENGQWIALDGTEASLNGNVEDLQAIDGNTMDANLTSVSNGRRSVSLFLRGFDLDIPAGTNVRGVELNIYARTERTDSEAELVGVFVRGFEGSPDVITKPVRETLNNSLTQYTIGGPEDNWRLDTMSPGNANDLLFFIEFRNNGAVGGGGTDFLVDHVALTIHYSDKRESTVYLREQNGDDVATGELIYTHVEDGSFDTDDAKGVVTVRLKSLTGNPANHEIVNQIRRGLEMRTQPSGGGIFIALTDSGAASIRLPGLESMQREQSRYEFIHRNFFSTDFLDAVYGVNGAGPAFTFNDNYFIRIRTGIGEDKNKPRHVEDFASSLVLGYGTGEFNVSVPNEPLDFSGVNGAYADGVGEKITGMLELQGTTLAIFTDRRIMGYQLGGAGELIPITISPSTGAIEYTVVDMGFPLYCDFRGISTISTSEKYGDFERGRFSYNVSRWLTPRLQGVREEGSIASDPHTRDIESEHGVAGVLLVRNKNQYRVIFNDGYVLTMTMLGDQPEFTIQRYWLKRDDAGDLEYEPEPMQLWATEYGTTTSGQDRIFVSALNYQHVLEMDRGNSFDGLPIESYLVANIMNFNSPGVNARYNVLHYHSLVGGYANLRQSFGVDYAEPDPDKFSQDVRLGDEQANWYRGPRPVFEKARTDSRGRDITIRLDHNSDLEAPFTLQTLEWLDVSPRRPER